MASHAVYCYMYDISGGMARNMSQMLVGTHIDAVYHTAVVVYGVEYFFDGGVGIEGGTPSCTRFGTPLKKLKLGDTRKTQAEFHAWNAAVGRAKYGPTDYHVLSNNCNHYADEAGKFLCGVGSPPEVANQVDVFLSTPFGRMMVPMIEQMMASVHAQPNTPPSSFLASAPPAPPPATDSGKISVTAIPRDLLDSLVDNVADGGLEALQTILRVLQNLHDHPEDDRYRILRVGNPRVHQLVGRHPDAVRLMEKVGFVLAKLAGTEDVLRYGAEYAPPSQELLDAVKAGVRDAQEMKAVLALSTEEEGAALAPRKAAEDGKEQGPPAAMWLPWTGAVSAMPQGHEADGEPLYAARHALTKAAGKCGRHLGTATAELVSSGSVGTAGPAQVLLACGDFRWARAAGEFLDFDLTLEKPVYFDERSRAIVVRAEHGGGLHPGYTAPGLQGCVIPYGGEAVLVEEYEVLLVKGRVEAAVSPGDARCLPLTSIDELLSVASSPAPVALRPQAGFRGFRYHTGEGTGPKVLVCHDMAGNYTEADGSPMGVRPSDGVAGAESLYHLRHWDIVDTFVYFSHHLVSIPPVGWIAAAKTMGRKCLGTFIIEGRQGASSLSEMLGSRDTIHCVVSALVALQVQRGFDGWLVNVEIGMTADAAEMLLYFVQRLTDESRTALPATSTVLWYDAVTLSGKVAYKNCLAFENLEFFTACDGLFTNYWWQKDTLAVSAELAGRRAADVYQGVDVFGRRTYGGGGMNTHAAFEAVQGTGLSVAVFAPAWTWENHKTRFISADDAMWGKIRGAYLEGKTARAEIVGLPFTTSFTPPSGTEFHVNGKRGWSKPWFNLSCTSPMPAHLPVTTEFGLRLSADGRPFDGSASLLLDYTEGTSPIAPVLLFDFALESSDAAASAPISVELVSRGADLGMLVDHEEGRSVLQPVDAGPEDPGEPAVAGGLRNQYCVTRQLPGGWVARRWRGVAGAPRAISAIFLRGISAKAEIGRLSVVRLPSFDVPTKPPAAPAVSRKADGSFSLEFPADLSILHYDIFAGSGVSEQYAGRTHNTYFEGRPILSRQKLRVEATDTAGQVLPSLAFEI